MDMYVYAVLILGNICEPIPVSLGIRQQYASMKDLLLYICLIRSEGTETRSLQA